MTRPAVRRADLADAAAIAAVHRLSRADYYGAPADPDDGREAHWERLLTRRGQVTHVAELDDVVVGFVSAERRGSAGPAWELTALYVLPGHVGRGIGARLYDEFDAHRGPGEGAELEVWAHNTRAVEFYRRRGWAATPRHRPGPDGHPFVTYRLAAEPGA